MQEDEFRMLSDRVLAAVALIVQRDDQLERRVPAIVEEQTSRWLKSIAGQIETAARTGLEPPLAACQQRVQSLGAETEQAVKAMEGARHGLASTLRGIWIGAGVCLLFSVLALIGTYQMLYGHYQTRYDDLKAQVTYLDALNHSDVVRCGEGRLCARIDDKAARVGDKKQYRLIETRP